MKLSIITVNLNDKVGLQKTANSIVSQTFKDYEWIVIDGGSTDGSKSVIESYADRIAYWVSEPDKGIYNAMNKGIEKANGEYMLFLNSGDWLVDENTLADCFAVGFDADVMYGDSLFVFEDKTEEYRYPSPLTFKDLYRGFLGHASSFIKSELIKGEKYNENYKIASDWEFWIKLSLRNASFRHIDKFVSYFDTTGISSTDDKLRKRERNQVIAEFVAKMIIEDYGYIKQLENQLDDNQVKQVLQYGNKKKVYHKLITLCLMVIRNIEKINCGLNRTKKQ